MSNASAHWVQKSGALICQPPADGTSKPTGGVNPWPWGSELTFPWTGIEGVWQATELTCGNLFMFEVVRDSKGTKIVNVYEYDPVRCIAVATGKGFESRKVVRAVMTGEKGPYQLTIHAFKATDLRSKSKYQSLIDDQVLVMRMRPLTSSGRLSTKSFSSQLEKVARQPTMICK